MIHVIMHRFDYQNQLFDTTESCGYLYEFEVVVLQGCPLPRLISLLLYEVFVAIRDATSCALDTRELFFVMTLKEMDWKDRKSVV